MILCTRWFTFSILIFSTGGYDYRCDFASSIYSWPRSVPIRDIHILFNLMRVDFGNLFALSLSLPMLTERLNRFEWTIALLSIALSRCRRVINARDAKPLAVRSDSGNTIRFLLDPDPILPIYRSPYRFAPACNASRLRADKSLCARRAVAFIRPAFNHIGVQHGRCLTE